MSRRSTSDYQAAAGRYPIRLRVLVPPGGFGMQIGEIQDWLNGRAGEGARIGADRDARRLPDTMSIYLDDLAVAVELVERFGLTLARTQEHPPPTGPQPAP